jgi:hypothetical protein
MWVVGGTSPLMYSTDGVEWKNCSADGIFRNGVNALASDGKKWVACGGSWNENNRKEDHQVAYSLDGISWVGLGSQFFTWWGGLVVTYANGLWLIGGQNLITTGPLLYYSRNGINWTPINKSPGSRPILTGRCYAISYNGKIWVAGGGANELEIAPQILFAYSYDGINWTNSPSTTMAEGAPRDKCLSICNNGDRFVACCVGRYNLGYSDDGINWTGVNLAESLRINNDYSVTKWDGSRFLAGSGNNLITSTNGIDWVLLSNTATNAIGINTNIDLVMELRDTEDRSYTINWPSGKTNNKLIEFPSGISQNEVTDASLLPTINNPIIATKDEGMQLLNSNMDIAMNSRIKRIEVKTDGCHKVDNLNNLNTPSSALTVKTTLILSVNSLIRDDRFLYFPDTNENNFNKYYIKVYKTNNLPRITIAGDIYINKYNPKTYVFTFDSENVNVSTFRKYNVLNCYGVIIGTVDKIIKITLQRKRFRPFGVPFEQGYAITLSIPWPQEPVFYLMPPIIPPSGSQTTVLSSGLSSGVKVNVPIVNGVETLIDTRETPKCDSNLYHTVQYPVLPALVNYYTYKNIPMINYKLINMCFSKKCPGNTVLKRGQLIVNQTNFNPAFIYNNGYICDVSRPNINRQGINTCINNTVVYNTANGQRCGILPEIKYI